MVRRHSSRGTQRAERKSRVGDRRDRARRCGEQQRVGIARALANNAELLLADEPTGQLDSHTAREIMGLIRSVAHAQGLTAITTTVR
jgi:ABC-type lipoprotein export system ATPase subunit